MLPDRVSNPGPLPYESGAILIALCGPPYFLGYRAFFPKTAAAFSFFHHKIFWLSSAFLNKQQVAYL